MFLKKSKISRGYTLTEIMVALVLNGFLVIALINVFGVNIYHYRRSLSANDLTEQLQTALFIMSSEIRRAGYYSLAYNDVGLHQNNNPFMSGSNDINVNSSNNCILFTYDHEGTGSLPSLSTSSDDDRYGFRLTNQILQIRPRGASFNCSANAQAWENITDPNIIQITNLTFTLNTNTVLQGTHSLLIRSVDVSITGNLRNDATTSKTLTAHIRIRNDKYVP